MARKQKSLASSFIKSVIRKRKAKSRENPREPSFWEETLYTLAPAGISYAAVKVVGRIARNLVMKRWPLLGKHTTPVASMIALLTIWIMTEKSKTLSKYQTPALIGASIATVTTLLKAYMPGLAAILLDEMGVSLPPPTTPLLSEGDDIAYVGDDDDSDMKTGIFAN